LEKPRPLALIVLDGWGINGALPEGDATELADTPVFRKLLRAYPTTRLAAAGLAVGLPDGTIGNSEVGHLNLGAGRVVYQDLTRINKAIGDGSFFANEVLANAFERAHDACSKVHLIGLCSDAGVHSHLDHLYALLELARRMHVPEDRVFIHAITDGRDSPPTSGAGYLRAILQQTRRVGTGAIASVCGRYHAMDRDRRWDRTRRAYDAIVKGAAPAVGDPVTFLESGYRRGTTDEFVEPFVVEGPDGRALAPVEDADTVIFFNFRADRARQVTRAIALEDFTPADGFDRGRRPRVHYVCMTRYDDGFALPVAFEPQNLTRILPDVLAERGLPQLRVAETEKYAHVTYFFNGGEETSFPLEERLLVPSAKEVPTYDLKPEMRAAEITDEALRRYAGPRDQVPGFLLLNYANADMVGHSGKIDPTKLAVEAVDRNLGRLIEAIVGAGGLGVVTADHGNAEQMIDPKTGGPHTAHTTNPVPFILVDDRGPRRRLRPEGGKLGDVAPTLLDLLGMRPPDEMTGRSLIL
jgi:2,3-bisphosphoglycerate-independent phosphoglycerate mutase